MNFEQSDMGQPQVVLFCAGGRDAAELFLPSGEHFKEGFNYYNRAILLIDGMEQELLEVSMLWNCYYSKI